jgi:hypothetical protein
MDSTVKKEESSNNEDSNSGPRIVYEMTSEDGFRAESADLTLLWRKVFEAVQDARLQHGLELNAVNPSDR